MTPSTEMIPPSVAEVVANVKSLRELMDERDRSYIERFNASERNVVTAMSAAEKAVATAMTAAERAVSTAMVAADKAVAKSEVAAEKRFDSVNEFRQTLADQQTTFARTDLVNARFDMLEKKIDSIHEYQVSQVGSFTALGKLWGYIVGLIGAFAAFFAYYVKG